mgnify:CR=1 FL=1
MLMVESDELQGLRGGNRLPAPGKWKSLIICSIVLSSKLMLNIIPDE